MVDLDTVIQHFTYICFVPSLLITKSVILRLTPKLGGRGLGIVVPGT